jgi:hypothetical protein
MPKGFIGSCDGGRADPERIRQLSNGRERLAGSDTAAMEAALDGTCD